MQRKTTHRGIVGYTATTKRTISNGSAFNGLFGTPTGVTTTLQVNPTINDTIRHMANMVVKHKNQTKKLYTYLKNKSASNEQFLRNLFDFQYTHMQYQEDEKGKEQLRQPNAAWRDRAKGIDCDCYSIFTATTIMHHPTLYPVLRVVRQPQLKTFHHVYVVIPKTPNADLSNKANYWVIDPVLDAFDKEINYAEKIDFIMKDFVIQELGGVSTALGCADANCDCAPKERHIIVSPNDLKGRLTAERDLLAAGELKQLDTLINRKAVINALNKLLSNWDDEYKRHQLVKQLRTELAHQAQPLAGVSSFLQNDVVKAGINLVPGGGFVNQGVDLLTSLFPSNTTPSKKVVLFDEYWPGGKRNGQPIIEVPAGAQWYAGYKAHIDKEAAPYTIEQLTEAFLWFGANNPQFIWQGGNGNTGNAYWQYLMKEYYRASKQGNTNTSNNSTDLLSSPYVKYGLIGLGALSVVGLAYYAISSNKHKEDK